MLNESVTFLRGHGLTAEGEQEPKTRKALLRLAIMFAWIPIAFAIGSATHSVNAFIIVMAIGLVAGVALRLTVLR